MIAKGIEGTWALQVMLELDDRFQKRWSSLGIDEANASSAVEGSPAFLSGSFVHFLNIGSLHVSLQTVDHRIVVASK